MRGRSCLTGLSLLVLAGCADAEPEAVPPPVPAVIDVPAASAGGACRLLEFAVIEESLGIRFDVAAATERGKTYSCVVRARGASYPELALAVTATSVVPADFVRDVAPEGARKLTGLGKAAYRRTSAASGEQGPVAEVGWLGADGRLASLRYVHPQDAEKSAANSSVDGLVTLAKSIDTEAL